MRRYSDLIKVAAVDMFNNRLRLQCEKGKTIGSMTGVHLGPNGGVQYDPLLAGATSSRQAARAINSDPDFDADNARFGRQQAIYNALKRYDNKQMARLKPDYSAVLRRSNPITAIYGDNGE